MVELNGYSDAGLGAVEQVPTLRDRIRTLPVAGAVPNHWEVGCKVVKFKDELPADAITFSRQRRAQELLLTSAGVEDQLSLGVYEHDRTRGLRRRVATVAHDDRTHLRQTLYEGFTTACHEAARIDGLPPSIAAIDAADPEVVFDRERVVGETDDGVVAELLGKLNLY